MRKLSDFIVARRRWILGVMVLLGILCAFLYPRVKINYDNTKYLPDDSPMKQGIDLMAAEFPPMGADKSIRVMADGLTAEQEAELLAKLKAIPYVESVAHDSSERYTSGTHSLFVLATSMEYGSPEERSIEHALEQDFSEYQIVYHNDNPGADGVPLWLYLVAGALLVVIMLVMCRSWFEPVLILVTIGIAIILNEGTNAFLSSISYPSSCIAAMLQMVLSIDYSVMLLNRFRQEKAAGLQPYEAMSAALRNCFASVSSSALTTAAGLLMLAFMRFKIGFDMGFVLAKGVLLSLLCALTVLPCIAVIGNRLIDKSEKKTLRLSMMRLARFSHKQRYILSVVFVVMFIAFYFLQGNTSIAYTLTKLDVIKDIFPPENALVIVYDNRDEEKISALEEQVLETDGVIQVISWPRLFGRAYTAAELPEILDSFSGMGFEDTAGVSFDPSMLSMVYSLYFQGSSIPAEEQKLTIPELFSFVEEKVLSNPLFASLVPANLQDTVAGAGELLENGMSMLKSARFSRMVIYTAIPVESEQTNAFMAMLKDAGKAMEGEYFLIGNSAMSDEMQGSFSGELWTITLLTAAAIFLIVLITSRSFIVPAVLVLIVQCGVYITVALVGWQGYQIYFLALLMVECVLMGATIDYGILFTNDYRESRRTLSSPEALAAAFETSVHSIMTSGMIIVLITGIFGYTYPDPTIAEICRTISIGALSAILLILLVLPGLLAALDRFITRRRKLLPEK